MGTGPEAIRDAGELATIRSQAARVHRRALVAALLLTLIAIVVP